MSFALGPSRIVEQLKILVLLAVEPRQSGVQVLPDGAQADLFLLRYRVQLRPDAGPELVGQPDAGVVALNGPLDPVDR